MKDPLALRPPGVPPSAAVGQWTTGQVGAISYKMHVELHGTGRWSATMYTGVGAQYCRGEADTRDEAIALATEMLEGRDEAAYRRIADGSAEEDDVEGYRVRALGRAISGLLSIVFGIGVVLVVFVGSAILVGLWLHVAQQFAR